MKGIGQKKNDIPEAQKDAHIVMSTLSAKRFIVLVVGRNYELNENQKQGVNSEDLGS